MQQDNNQQSSNETQRPRFIGEPETQDDSTSAEQDSKQTSQGEFLVELTAALAEFSETLVMQSEQLKKQRDDIAQLQRSTIKLIVTHEVTDNFINEMLTDLTIARHHVVESDFDNDMSKFTERRELYENAVRSCAHERALLINDEYMRRAGEQ